MQQSGTSVVSVRQSFAQLLRTSVVPSVNGSSDSRPLLTIRCQQLPLALLDFHNLRVMRGQKIALDDFTLRIGAENMWRSSARTDAESPR